jgi:hypothetical protein
MVLMVVERVDLTLLVVRRVAVSSHYSEMVSAVIVRHVPSPDVICVVVLPLVMSELVSEMVV